MSSSTDESTSEKSSQFISENNTFLNISRISLEVRKYGEARSRLVLFSALLYQTRFSTYRQPAIERMGLAPSPSMVSFQN